MQRLRATCSAAAQPLTASTPRPIRQRTLVSQRHWQQQQQQQQWRQRPLRLVAAQVRPVVAVASDAGDDFEEMLGRREELLRIKDEGIDTLGGLNTDEDEELATLTDRLLKFGYLEDTDNLDELEAASDTESDSDLEEDEETEEDEDDEDDDEDDDDDVVDVVAEQVDVVAGGDDEAASQRQLPSQQQQQQWPQQGGGGVEADDEPARRRYKVGPDMAIDDILSQAQLGGAADMRGQDHFVVSSPDAGSSNGAAPEDLPQDKFPDPPERRYSLSQLLQLAGYAEQAATAPEVEVLNLLTCNSITGGEQSLYVCVPSAEGHDGHEYADEAGMMGAVAVVADREMPDALLPVVVVDDVGTALGRLADAFYERPSRRMRTIGMVGSYGKTTSAWLARGMFEETGERCGMIGNIEYALEEVRLSEEGEVWEPEEEDVTLQRDCSSPFHVTPYEGKYPEVPPTPDALHMQKVLAGCADRGAAVTLLELDPAALGDGRCDHLDLDVLVYTNSHAEKEEDAPGGRQACADNVRSLFGRLTDLERQRAVINIDDELGAELAKTAVAAGVTVLTTSYKGKEADIYAEKAKSTIWETETLINTPLGRLQIITPLLGRTNVSNVLAAVGTGIACGVPLKAIVAGIEAVDIIPGRCELIDEGQMFSVLVDSASTPQQVSRLLDDVRDAGSKRIMLLVGCPGTATKEFCQEMAQVAHAKSDLLFITNDNPGLRWPDAIVADMVTGLPEELLARYPTTSYPYLQDPHRVPQWFSKLLQQYQSALGVFVVEDRFQAIRVAIGMAKARDVVVVVGKGHRDWQEYWDWAEHEEGAEPALAELTLKSWFDDRVECRNALSKLSYLNGIKELSRDHMPWTRYPEDEREILAVEAVRRDVEVRVGAGADDDEDGDLPLM